MCSSDLHVFPYSSRAGTPAAHMPQLAPALIKRRAGDLRAAGARRLDAFLDAAVGSSDQLLVEAGNRGHGRQFCKIRLDGPLMAAGQLVDVEITGRDGTSLVGRVTGV